MPRDELVGSLGRPALKPAEFREQVSVIGLCYLHDLLSPHYDDSGSGYFSRAANAARVHGRRLEQDAA
jgi:hypothetical protein